MPIYRVKFRFIETRVGEVDNAEYDGGTDVRWDSQMPVRNEEGRVTLECQEGHQWSAEFTPDATGA